MAAKELKNIFLSASIPYEERDAMYFKTADIIAIRDAVVALATVALPNHRLIWGGHPSITPIINYVMERLDLDIQEHVTIYQSLFFEHSFPEENNKFEKIVQVEECPTEKESLLNLRRRMFLENRFVAAIFIGGMGGIKDEYDLFTKIHPEAILLPVASTGAAAKTVYEQAKEDRTLDERLAKDYGYMSLFQELLIDKIKNG